MSNDSPRVPPAGASPQDNLFDTSRNVLLKLRELPLFKTLSEEEFRRVTSLLRAQRVSQGALLIEQGGTNTNLYILRQGRAAIRAVDLQDVERLQGFINVGTVFNDAAFLTGVRNLQSVEALEELVLWYVARDEFRDLLDRYPGMESRLVYPVLPDLPPPNLAPEAREFVWQRSGETIMLFRKKHPWVFFRSLWPLLLGVLIIVILLPVVNAFAQPVLTPILVGLGVIITPYFILRWVDWQNDYYAITDQRILHRERVLLIRDEQYELPLSKIQDVKISRPSLLALVFDMGDVTIEAMGARAKVRFEEVGQPDEVGEAIFNQLKRSRVESHASQRSKIRSELRRELGLGSGAPTAGAGAGVGKVRTPPLIRKRFQQYRKSLGMLRNTLLPRMRLVEGDTITYRKHWLQLLQTIALPLALSVGFMLVLALIVVTGHELASLLFSVPFVLLPLFAGIGLFGWLVYRYEDWRNDIYMVMSDRIVDIDRSPFGLFGSSRKEAKISAIQNVNSKTRGMVDVAFNMGDVIIETAGGEGQLTFERVYAPHRVQRDITDRIDAVEAATREQQASQRRQEMTEWLGIYDELTRLQDRRKSG